MSNGTGAAAWGVDPVDVLLSLPPASAERFAEIVPYRPSGPFAASDPPGVQLGSAGGTAHLLACAWQASSAPREGPGTFPAWLRRTRKVLIHGSGESRRLPAYASAGKPLIPLPPFPGCAGQRLDPFLLDLQTQQCSRLFRAAPAGYRVLVACGDVLVEYGMPLPPFPRADILVFGIPADAEEAARHGVVAAPRSRPSHIAAFLQKPSADRFRAAARNHQVYLDTGIWLLSERAVAALMDACGWQADRETFRHDVAGHCDLYGEIGPALGHQKGGRDARFSELVSAVLPIPDGRFYHFGTNRGLLASAARLMRPDRRAYDDHSLDFPLAPVVLNATVECRLTERNRYVWIENAMLAAGWTLGERHVLTGIPANDWRLEIEAGICLDVARLDERDCALRFYGFDDPFRGRIGSVETVWLGRPAIDWFGARGLRVQDCGADADTDIQDAALFPVLPRTELGPERIRWLTEARPAPCAEFARWWARSRRVSAKDLLRTRDLVSEFARRRRALSANEAFVSSSRWLDLCGRVDMEAALPVFKGEGWMPPDVDPAAAGGRLSVCHDRMFRSLLERERRPDQSRRLEHAALERLRTLIVASAAAEPAAPRRNVQEDQIVWGRCPIRLDLAGGWTDTPPYCLQHGGCVVNLAVDLNGQPPIQVFGRIGGDPVIVVRSIDLGMEDRIADYRDLALSGGLGSGFGIARAALALAGFEPRFRAAGGAASLERQLRADLGGGLELSMLAAVPKGSGLGASSVLGSALLGTLNELLGLGWSTNAILQRTLALEQMLTSGGGWQDQAGGMLGGVKLMETAPGILQLPTVRWLPGTFFEGDGADGRVLLYYTGITRVAHDILGEIVRGLFLNSARRIRIVEEIAENARFAADALQRNNWESLCEAVRRSWILNQHLDTGTNPPPVQAILERVSADLAAAKLLGAGGGGYLLMLAQDARAAQRIRAALTEHPPNARARFVNLSLSRQGFQVTRS